jgi:hypothetical protein
LAVVPTQILQRLQQCRYTGLALRIVNGLAQKYADAPYALGLLRAGP